MNNNDISRQIDKNLVNCACKRENITLLTAARVLIQFWCRPTRVEIIGHRGHFGNSEVG